MNIINIEHISKIYGEKVIFNDVSYGIHEGDKIGIIGINGTGKTTLLRIIAGLETPDSGQVTRQNGLKMAWLPQNPEFPADSTVLSYVAGDGPDSWELESEAKTILNRLGISEYGTLTAQLSGGQRKRVALARTILHPADVLILDEPTNHIDNEMAAWLEDYLNRFRGVLIMVTHDRYFLDRVTNKILEIDHGSLYAYSANYSQFLELKAEREEMALASERKRQSVLRMELEWAKRGCRARTTKQRARLERLEALKDGKAPAAAASVEMEAIETRMGRKTVELHHVSKSFGNKKLIDDFNYIVLKNQRLGIIGKNGCGKSTLMKLIAGLLEPDMGEIIIGDTVRIGYFAQEIEDMDGRRRVIDYIKDVAEYIQTKDGRISASQMLERFLFDSAMQYTPISKLSGGEKRRLYLLKVLSSAPNLLILDEPTNDLDIPTLTILEDYLDSFVGIVITVSHDRYFLDNVVDRLFAFEDNGRLRQYEGGYTDYLVASGREAEAGIEGKGLSNGRNNTSAKKSDGARESLAKKSNKDWKQNRPVKLKFTYNEQREFETIDDDIAAIEERLEAIETETARAATDFVKLNQLMQESEELKQKLDEKMERWVYLNDLAERIEAQKKT